MKFCKTRPAPHHALCPKYFAATEKLFYQVCAKLTAAAPRIRTSKIWLWHPTTCTALYYNPLKGQPPSFHYTARHPHIDPMFLFVSPARPDDHAWRPAHAAALWEAVAAALHYNYSTWTEWERSGLRVVVNGECYWQWTPSAAAAAAAGQQQAPADKGTQAPPGVWTRPDWRKVVYDEVPALIQGAGAVVHR